MNMYHFYAELTANNGKVYQRVSGHANLKESISTPELYEQISAAIETDCRANYGDKSEHLCFNLISLSRLN